MIRMGRNSRTDTSDAPNYQGQTAATSDLSYQYSPEATAATASRPVTDSESMARDIKEGRLSGYVGHGTALSGETHFQAMLRVDGHLTGTVSSDSGTLIVGSNGQVDANINVSSATINGTVNGDIAATEKIHLGRTARVIGNLTTPRLVLEDGAILEGGCTMLKARESLDKKVSETEAHNAAAELERYQQSQVSTTDEYTSSVTDESEEEDEDTLADAAII